VRAADAAAQLVQLGQAEAVGAMDDDGVGARDVDAGFDDGGAHQHVEALAVEIEHHLFQLALGHLAVGDADACFGHQFVPDRAPCARCSRLRCAGNTPGRRARVRAGRPRATARHPIAWTKVCTASRCAGGVAMIERSRSPAIAMLSVRGIGVAVSVSRCTSARSLQTLLLAHAEALLLVDDDEAEVLELHVFLQQAVGADDHVDLALGQLEQLGLDLLRGLEARQHFDPQRPVGEAVAEVAVVLFRQQRGRHQHATCLPALAATKAARTATSVLPKPTSPQTTRSIGWLEPRSVITASIALQLVGGFLERKLRRELLVHRAVKDPARGRRAPGAWPGSPAAPRPRRAPSRRPSSSLSPIARRRANAAARVPARPRRSG
jgi:hypothetical protein